MSTEPKVFKTPEGRLAFVKVLKAEEFSKGDGKPYYSTTILFPKSDTETRKQLEKFIFETVNANSRWTPEEKKAVYTDMVRQKIGDGDTKTYAGYAGMFFVQAKNDRKPGVVDAKLKEILTPEEIYSGCYGKISFAAFTTDKGGKKVGFSLRAVMKTRDGENLVPQLKASDDFDAVEIQDEESSELGFD